MKKFLLFCLVLWAMSEVKSQENWLFSPSLGANLVPISESALSGITSKFGLSLGFSSMQKIDEHWSWSMGISGNRRFATYTTESVSDELTGLLNLPIPIPGLSNFDLNVYKKTSGLTSFWTIDLPITCMYALKSGFFFYGGGYVNYMVSVKNEETVNTHIPVFEFFNPEDLITDPVLRSLLPENKTEKYANESTDNLNKFDYGVLAGIGYMSEKWMLKMGYHYGLNDIRSDKMKMDIKNQRAVTLSIAYLFSDLFTTSKEKPIYNLDLIE
jgi:hypothetical protein